MVVLCALFALQCADASRIKNWPDNLTYDGQKLFLLLLLYYADYF